MRQTQHPLAHRDDGEHVIDQVRRALRHPPPAAAGTDRSPLAGKRYQSVQPAAGAAKLGEAAREEPAAQKAPELRLDEPRQSVTIARAARLGPERLEVIACDLVQHALRGRLRRIVGRSTHALATANGAP